MCTWEGWAEGHWRINCIARSAWQSGPQQPRLQASRRIIWGRQTNTPLVPDSSGSWRVSLTNSRGRDSDYATGHAMARHGMPAAAYVQYLRSQSRIGPEDDPTIDEEEIAGRPVPSDPGSSGDDMEVDDTGMTQLALTGYMV